jgi:hypothetical protein
MPLGLITPCSCIVNVVLGEEIMFAHATTADSHSPAVIAWQASYKLFNDEEQAVRMVTLQSLVRVLCRMLIDLPWSCKAKLVMYAIGGHVVAVAVQAIHVVVLRISSVELHPISLEGS